MNREYAEDMFETRTISLVVGRHGEPIFAEGAYQVSIEDEGAGEYVSVTTNCEEGRVTINPEDWPALRAAIDRMVGECR